jgi:hypothetical protein
MFGRLFLNCVMITEFSEIIPNPDEEEEFVEAEELLSTVSEGIANL